MSDNIHVGDIGTVFTVVIVDDVTGAAIDISTATTKSIIFQAPNKASTTQTATFTTDGTDGSMFYTTATAADLNQSGQWKIQGKVIAPTFTNSSEKGAFYVKKNL